MRLFTLFSFALLAVPGSAQLFNAEATNISITTGTTLTVEGDVVLNTGSNITNEGDLHVVGDWTNNSGSTGVTPFATGTVLLHGIGVQNIQGTSVTDFRNLVIAGGNKVLQLNTLCGTPLQSDGTLTLNGAVLELNGRTLSIFNPAGTAVVDGGGSVRSESTDLLSRFQWSLGSDLSEHRIPFSDGSGFPLPFAYTPVVPAPLNTILSVATYPTAPDNTVFPVTTNQQVLHVAGAGIPDNSPNTVDRFWLVDLPNGSFTGSMLLSYSPSDDPMFGPGPVRAQRWLEGTGTWENPLLPGQSGPALREVLVPNVLFSDAITPTNEHIWALAYDNTPLPVELLHFDGTCAEGLITLNWATASELNCERFEIERYSDAEGWKALGALPALGDGTGSTRYAFTDRPPDTEDALRYRLMEVEASGRSVALRTIVVQGCTFDDRMMIFPNPADMGFTVRIPSHLIENTRHLDVRDALGRSILRMNGAELALRVMVNVHDLNPGAYTVALSDDLGVLLDKRQLVVRH